MTLALEARGGRVTLTLGVKEGLDPFSPEAPVVVRALRRAVAARPQGAPGAVASPASCSGALCTLGPVEAGAAASLVSWVRSLFLSLATCTGGPGATHTEPCGPALGPPRASCAVAALGACTQPPRGWVKEALGAVADFLKANPPPPGAVCQPPRGLVHLRDLGLRRYSHAAALACIGVLERVPQARRPRGAPRKAAGYRVRLNSEALIYYIAAQARRDPGARRVLDAILATVYSRLTP